MRLSDFGFPLLSVVFVLKSAVRHLGPALKPMKFLVPLQTCSAFSRSST
jgi:hypothetical protein